VSKEASFEEIQDARNYLFEVRGSGRDPGPEGLLQAALSLLCLPSATVASVASIQGEQPVPVPAQ
jgi:hypothetical protein